MCRKGCVIITTVNRPTPAILKHIGNPEVDVIIVADEKTPASEYEALDCIFLSLEKQLSDFPGFDALLPRNHYARKNMGYLYAMREGYDIIAETDDDNIPYDDWTSSSLRPGETSNAKLHSVGGPKFVNIYRLFTDVFVWPRGLPLNNVLDDPFRIRVSTADNATAFFDDVSILQGLADGDPDVDAIFRLTAPAALDPLLFNKTGDFYKLERDHYCPGNTQNTTWLNPLDFHLLYVPSHVSFRFCDTLKMYIAQAFVQHSGRSMAFQGATVFQDRNPHDVLEDFRQECEMYVHVERLVAILEECLSGSGSGGMNAGDLVVVYERLVEEGIVKDAREISLLKAWLKAVKDCIQQRVPSMGG